MTSRLTSLLSDLGRVGRPGFGNTAGPESGERFFATVSRLLGHRDWALVLWDGRRYGSPSPQFTLTIAERRGLDQLIGSLPERGFGRAYVTGAVEVEPLGRFLSAFSQLPTRRILAAGPSLLRAALALGARPDLSSATSAEARLRGRRHSRRRDAEAIAHHYDLPPEFYGLFLDDSLTYSCAYFERPEMSLGEAQQAKLEYVCRKLRLRPDETLLDIGCGWGSLALHAARHHGVRVVAITLSPTQAEYARRRVASEGLTDRVEVRLADYRDPMAERFHAVASIGMVEHVGRAKMPEFGKAVHRLLIPGGRALIHGITMSPRQRWNRASFNDAFVFPDGELEDIGFVDTTLELTGLELRDVESLREHYARTTAMWVQRLEQHWDEAVQLVGAERARVWRLYLSGAQVGFSSGSISIHQSLLVRPDPDGMSGLPLSRADWYTSASRELDLSEPRGAGPMVPVVPRTPTEVVAAPLSAMEMR